MKAFPYEEWLDSIDPQVVNPIRHGGMDLRDYFAASAMQGFLANAYIAKKMKVQKVIFAELSYEMADALMVERNLKNGYTK
jgi:hypothetical protein